MSARAIVAELASSADQDALVAVIKETPSLEMLVNNAGFGHRSRFHEAPIEVLDEMLSVHAQALIKLMHAALPGMLARNRGDIINVSSLASFFPYPRNAMYSATKALVTNLSETLHLELDETGVRVQALCPGMTRTDFHTRMGMDPERAYRDRGLRRAMTAEEAVDCSLKALVENKAVCVPGIHNQLSRLMIRTLPRAAVYRLAKAMFGRRR